MDNDQKSVSHRSSMVMHTITDETEKYLSRFDLVKRVLSIDDSTKSMKTKIVASLVPDEIIYNVQKEKQLYYNGAILFADISGFTDLTEKYCNMGKGGSSRLTQVLNNYIGAMVQEIMSHMGDVLKFSGDAFLALWKATDNSPMTEVVHSAIDCALNIQKTHGFYKTEVGVLLRVKIAISAGSLICSLVQNSFLMMGGTIWDVKGSGDLCGPGDIIVSQSVLSFLNKEEYTMSQMVDKEHLKIIGIGQEWSPIQFSSQYEHYDDKDLKSVNSEKDEDVDVLNPYNTEDLNITLQDYTLRPSIDYAVNNQLIDSLQSYVIRPVWNVIELDEPLEYLTEMRHVIIVFVNVKTYKINVSNLIKKTDVINSIVYNVSTSYEGCVNKVSMFDKDLMFLIIFGLRGLKHALESQMALRCSKEMQTRLQEIDGVKSASIGVTSGLTYCGVVGHPLRREYTVIGSVVNKAARLMVAYESKVTCDQQTFLYSKLKAAYFILQEPKPLKGFKYVGPIYEFEEPANIEDDATNDHLLLGREKEVDDFEEFLDNLMHHKTPNHAKQKKDNYKNTFLLKGKSREGKTLLFNNLIEIARPLLPIHKITLTIYDQKIPCKAIQLIFAQMIGLQDNTTIEKRTHLVAHFLQGIKVPHFLCSLNDILNVNFEETSYYDRLTDQMKQDVRNKMIKYLCARAFPEKWLIAIDSAEHVDNESWVFMQEIVNLDMVYILITLGTVWKYTTGHQTFEEDPRVKTIVIQNIDKWYHAAIACQILNVDAIPLELEKMIQEYSKGSPGWIESFLTTLLQAGNIYETTATVQWVYEQGYVKPLKHKSSRKKRPSQSVQVLTDTGAQMVYALRGWEMYKYTFKDITVKHYNSDRELKICSLSPNFNVSDVMGVTIDGQMMRQYDSLTLKEQLLLKCSSVLGDLFSRAMLKYMLPSVKQLEIAHIVQKLFEIRVLVCARGDFRDNFTHIIHSTIGPETKMQIECECIGLKIDESCRDLPNYANCGFMRFRESKFREMLYNLLTDNQMKQYHTRAIWFLENETKRCRACEGGYFYQLNGVTFNDGMRKKNKVKMIPKFMTEAELTVLTKFHPEYLSENNNSVRYTLGQVRVEKSIMKNKNIRKINAVHIINCECRLILSTMYQQMYVHCEAAELYERLIQVLLEYANLSVSRLNFPIAFNLLKTAEHLLETKLKPTFTDPEWQEPMLLGRIHTIYGFLYVTCEKNDESLKSLKLAIKCYGLKFPSNSTRIKYLTMCKELRLSMLCTFYDKLAGSEDSDDCLLHNQTAETLFYISKVFKMQELWDEAYLSSVWCLTEALKADSNYDVLARSYANYIIVCHHKQIDMLSIEKFALRICFRKETKMEVHELESTIELYGSIFYNRFTRVPLGESLTIGKLLLPLHVTTYLPLFQWQLLPLLVQALMLTHTISDAVNLIKEIEFMVADESNYLGPMLYYGMCVNIRLLTGYCIVHFEKCEKYFHGNKMMRTPKTCTEMFFYSNMWLWYVRVKNWESADLIFDYLKDLDYLNKIYPINVLSYLNIFEGLLLRLVNIINTKDNAGIEYLDSKITHICKILSQYKKKMTTIEPRIKLLKAYWKAIYSINDVTIMPLLNSAKDLAVQYENKFDEIFIDHTKKLWENTLPPPKSNEPTWSYLSKEDHFINWDKIGPDFKIPCFEFTLPD